jgi:hypothetical protein
LFCLAFATPAAAQQVVTTVTSTNNGATTAVATTTPTGAAAQNASIGALNSAFSPSGVSGAATPGANTGLLESNILSAVSINQAALYISQQMKGHEGVLIVTGAAMPDTSAYQAFQARIHALGDQIRQDTALLDAALAESTGPAARHPGESLFMGSLSGPETVGVGLNIIGKSLSYLATDFQASGVTVSVDDYSLAVALLRQEPSWRLSSQIDVSSEVPSLLSALDALSPDVKVANQRIAAGMRKAAELTAGDKPTTAQKAVAKDIQTVITVLSADLAAYSTFVSNLSAPGVLNGIAQSKVLAEKAKAAGVVFVRVHSAAGGVITKKNLLSSIGVTPILVSGGVVVSYSYLHGETAKAGLFTEVTPYRSIVTTKKVVRLDRTGACDTYAKGDAQRYCPTRNAEPATAAMAQAPLNPVATR